MDTPAQAHSPKRPRPAPATTRITTTCISFESPFRFKNLIRNLSVFAIASYCGTLAQSGVAISASTSRFDDDTVALACREQRRGGNGFLSTACAIDDRARRRARPAALRARGLRVMPLAAIADANIVGHEFVL